MNDFPVDLLLDAGSDQFICQAARVSTKGAAAYGTDESEGLLNYLMRDKHGSPFEHGLMSFRITAPIFVWREFMRHRIGWSYNEQSGRYMEMLPEFYIPPRKRDLVQKGKAGKYEFFPGTDEQFEAMVDELTDSYMQAWGSYSKLLSLDVAREVARIPLPLGIYSSAYVTCNPRSMMSFLTLRTKDEGSMFPSYPQWEINQVATKMENEFKRLYPLTHKVFQAHGRVAP
jgi:thymidylate synthase (FAD)